jgi:hypothetical protein
MSEAMKVWPLRQPSALRRAVEAVAQASGANPSAYVRQLLIEDVRRVAGDEQAMAALGPEARAQVEAALQWVERQEALRRATEALRESEAAVAALRAGGR